MSTTELPPTGVDDEATEVFDDDVHVHRDDALVLDLERPDGQGADARGTVDPRMRDRWITQRRVEGRRRLRVLMAAVAVGSVLALAYVIARSPLLGADQVEIRGTVKTSARAVRAAAGISDGAPLLFLDTGAVARRVERLPYVARADVTTDLPHTVTIRVVERTPVAWVRGDGGVVLLDGSGRVLERLASPPAGLTQVTGTSRPGPPGTKVADPAAFIGLRDFPPALALLAERVRVRGGEAVVIARGADPLVREIRLGPLVDVRAKAAAALAVLADLDGRGEHARYVDVRVPSAPATA
jgi:POTRA domain, FtsQ-type